MAVLRDLADDAGGDAVAARHLCSLDGEPRSAGLAALTDLANGSGEDTVRSMLAKVDLVHVDEHDLGRHSQS